MASPPFESPTVPAERRVSADNVGRYPAAAPLDPSFRRHFVRWAFAIVPTVAVGELVAQAVVAARVPTPGDWRAAHDYIATQRRPGDLVTSAPTWTDPLARMYFADMISLRDAGRADATGYPRALVATVHGAANPDLAGWRTVDARSFGTVTVRTVVNPQPARILFDFADHLHPTEADVFRDAGQPVACRWMAGMVVAGGGLGQGALAPPSRFVCGEPWNYVGVTLIEDMAHRGRRCIWSHPIAGGVMRTIFGDVPMGTVLHGHHGIAYEAERGDDLGNVGGPVTLRVLIDDTEIGEATHNDYDGWKGFDLDTRRYAGTSHRVTFEVRAAEPGMRHYCYTGDTR